MNTPDPPPLAQIVSPGPVTAYRNPLHIAFEDAAGWDEFASCVVRFAGDDYDDPQGMANAALIKETFDVTTETGRTPRQLADERAELISSLKDCHAAIDTLFAQRIAAEEGSYFPSLSGAPWDAVVRAAELLTRLTP